ncbi:MAG: ATP-binding protein [Lachnospiraceae bacterium]|nr:ATP-binding protein [Lachnospiraceae bacterium]
MALSNAKYDAIMRRYNENRIQNERERRERIREVCEALPAYKALSDDISSMTLSYGLRALDGEEGATEEFKKRLRETIEKKEALLASSPFGSHYLDPIYSCPDCQDTGYIGNEKCHCLKQAIITELYKQSNIADILSRENFSTLSYDYYNDDEIGPMREIISDCRKFADDFGNRYENLLFFGPPGVGKTFLTNCITKELLDKGYSVIYFTSTQLFDTLATYLFRNYDTPEEIVSLHEDIFSCDLFILDDLGTEAVTKIVVSQLFLLLNERLLRRKSTIISTNLAMNDLSERYMERSVSRIIGNYRLINPKIDDIRFRMRKRKISD